MKNQPRNSKNSCISRMFLAVFLSLVLLPATTPAEAATYKMYKVITGKNGNKGPFQTRADLSGGQVKVEILFRHNCKEQTTFTWDFNKNIEILRQGEDFQITTRTEMSGNCRARSNPFAKAGSGILPLEIGSQPMLTAAERNARPVTQRSTPNTEAAMRIYGKRSPGISRVGLGSDRFAAEGDVSQASVLQFTINLTAASDFEQYGGRITYFFRLQDTAGNDNARSGTIQSFNFRDHYIRHRNYLGEITRIVSDLDVRDASFNIVSGLAGGTSISFESVNYPGHYLRHQGFRVMLHRLSNDQLFRQDASFKRVSGLANGTWTSFESVNYPGYFIRHKNFHLHVERGNSDLFRKDATFRIVN